MTSSIDITTIDATKPIHGNPTTASVRDNMLAIKNALGVAKTEIEAGQAADVTLQNLITALQSEKLDTSAYTTGISDLKGGVGTAGDTLKKLYDLIIGVGQLVGDFDASSGALPTTGTGLASAIDKGDSWHITVAGTLPAGLTPTVNVKAGDVLVARIAGATVGADFYVIENTTAQATSSALGILKLYTDLAASNTDGSVTQAAIVSALAAIFTTANAWTKAQNVAQVALTSTAASIAIDVDLSNEFIHALTEDTTLENPTNVAAGKTWTVVFIQHASSAKTFAVGSNYHAADGTAFTMSTTLGAINVLVCHANTATHITCNFIKHGVA